MSVPSRLDFHISPENEGTRLSFLDRQRKFTAQPVTDVDLSGKTALIVGANCGIVLEVARQFLGLGITKTHRCHKATIECWPVELASYESTFAFAKRAEELDRMDHIVLNAGMCATKFETNPTTGHEVTVQINYLSTALLASLLLPIAKAKRAVQNGPSRITFTLSDVCAWTSFSERSNVPLLPALDVKGSLTSATALTDRRMVSKLLGQFFIRKLASIVPSSVAVINWATPGMVHDTQIVKPIIRMSGYTSDVGARHITDAALHHHNDRVHGQYLSMQRIKPMAPILYTEEGKRIAEQLWKETMMEFAFAIVEQLIATAAKE
ncbi:hypothetical protein VHEMI04325 [[Torrubiella] hemipterigena]|uniref:Uncharacterized protein n=1 Tax=[Torrubiella] hemipterigena TaxID=1531966 RepID=A0A0A1TDH5_9HYPO|nr:hypothetical protein VHEMI04325 [[Torrubiella] hemipterigena]